MICTRKRRRKTPRSGFLEEVPADSDLARSICLPIEAVERVDRAAIENTVMP
jgi:hypothetical protein